jgi:hypothetical protein
VLGLGDASIWLPEPPDVLWQCVEHFCRFGLDDVALDDGEYGLDGFLGIYRLSSAHEAIRNTSYKLLARTHGVWLNSRTILLVESSTNQQGQLGGKMRRVLDGEPIAQNPKDDAKNTPSQSTIWSDLF